MDVTEIKMIEWITELGGGGGDGLVLPPHRRSLLHHFLHLHSLLLLQIQGWYLGLEFRA